MTVSTDTRRVQYATNGTTGPFTVTFPFLESSHLAVTHTDSSGVDTDLVLNVDYTVAGTNISTTVAYPAGGTITIDRDIAITQELDLRDGDEFPADSVEDALDKLTMILQQISVEAGRTLRAPEITADFPELPAAADRALRLLGFDANGDPIGVLPTAGDATALALDLASTASNAKGAGQVGWLFSRNYAANTIGWAVQRTGITPSMCGAVGDGVTDDTTALQAWASSAFPKVGESKTFKVTGQITFAAGSCVVDGRGMVIDASAGGTFTDSSVVYCTGSLSAIPDLSVSPAVGATSLTWGSAHTLAQNDVFIIYNPTDSSWSGLRNYYRAGEFCQVNRVTSSTAATLWTPLYSAYTAANVDVYKMASNRVAVKNMTVIAPSSGSIRPLRLRLATSVRLEDVRCYGSDYVGIELDRCFDVEARGLDLYEQPSSYSDEYGISIGNCQNVRVIGGTISGARHAVTIGGDDFTGSVPCRNVKIIGATLRNDFANGGAPAADIHGNAQDIHYENCLIYGGGSFGGLDNFYRGCRFYEGISASTALIIGGSECMGGVYLVEGCHLESSPAFSNGLIRAFSSTNGTKDLSLLVKNCTVSMGSCDTFVRVDMGSSTYKANAHIENITFLSSASLANICRMVGTGSAGDGDYVIVDNIANAKSGASLYAALTGYGSTVKVRLMSQAGESAMTMNTGAAFTSVTPTFRYSYGSKTPVIQGATLDTRAIDNIPLVVSHRLKSATAVTFDVGKANNANPTTGPTVTVNWRVGLDEI